MGGRFVGGISATIYLRFPLPAKLVWFKNNVLSDSTEHTFKSQLPTQEELKSQIMANWFLRPD